MRWAATFAAAALAGLAAVWWFAVALDIVGLILGTDGRPGEDDYRALVEDAVQFLSGRSTKVQEGLAAAMSEASAALKRVETVGSFS